MESGRSYWKELEGDVMTQYFNQRIKDYLLVSMQEYVRNLSSQPGSH